MGNENSLTVTEEKLRELFEKCHDFPWDHEDGKHFYNWLAANAKAGHIIIRKCNECQWNSIQVTEEDLESSFEKFCICLDCKKNRDDKTHKELIS